MPCSGAGSIVPGARRKQSVSRTHVSSLRRSKSRLDDETRSLCKDDDRWCSPAEVFSFLMDSHDCISAVASVDPGALEPQVSQRTGARVERDASPSRSRRPRYPGVGIRNTLWQHRTGSTTSDRCQRVPTPLRALPHFSRRVRTRHAPRHRDRGYCSSIEPRCPSAALPAGGMPRPSMEARCPPAARSAGCRSRPSTACVELTSLARVLQPHCLSSSERSARSAIQSCPSASSTTRPMRSSDPRTRHIGNIRAMFIIATRATQPRGDCGESPTADAADCGTEHHQCHAANSGRRAYKSPATDSGSEPHKYHATDSGAGAYKYRIPAPDSESRLPLGDRIVDGTAVMPAHAARLYKSIRKHLLNIRATQS